MLARPPIRIYPEDGDLSFRFVRCSCGMEFSAHTTVTDPSGPFRAFCPRCLRTRSFYANGLPMDY